MKIKGIDHITINCCKMDDTRRFYEKVLNLKRCNDIDLGNHVLHYYQLYGDTKLELIEYKEPQKQRKTNNTDTGIYRHFAVCVDDIQEVRRRCDKENYPLNLEPTYIPDIGRTVMLMVDPNGVEVEVIQA